MNMYRFVPFEEIDKNKWNGTVHYAPNGNTFGYYWYLKSILKEWDAIVEDDYESVMPVINRPMRREMLELLPELGPYSVNILNTSRVGEMLNMSGDHTQSLYYPVSNRVSGRILEQYPAEEKQGMVLSTRPAYEQICEQYGQAARYVVTKLDKSKWKMVSGLKPEDIVAQGNWSNERRHALMRMMYNALHRGVGFSSGVTDKDSNNFLAVSFFVVSHNVIHEICQWSKDSDPAPRQFIFDLLIRNQAEKGMTIRAYSGQSALQELGFHPETTRHIQMGKGRFVKWKKLLDLPL